VELTHTFTVPASQEETWRAFNDIEDVAGCFPGASVTSVEGDEFKGSCKVKLGPISLVYTGAGNFVERDESAGRFVIEAKGKDKRGNGTAGAKVTAQLTPAGDTTDVQVVTDLSITGKPAQFGRGVIEDVSNKLLQQFVACLESKVGAPAEAPAPAEAAAPAAAPEAAAEAAPAPGTTPVGEAAAAAAAGRPGVTAGPEEGKAEAVEALDLGATVLPILAKAYWRQIAAGVLVLLVLRALIRRRRQT
jgi:carbon monoxide dehydrogenase subunit G